MFNLNVVLGFVLVLAPAACGADLRTPLSGPSMHWTVSSGNVSAIVAPVPGMVQEALLAASILEDPLFRFNELLGSWVGQSDWTYATSFDAPAAAIAPSRTQLRFRSLDTVADVYLNGHHVGESESAFVPGVFPVPDGVIKEHGNELRVNIHSPLAYGRAMAKKHDEAEGYVVPLSHYYNTWDDGGGHGRWSGNFSKDNNYIRKPANDFGWDWGPAIIPVGIPGDVILEVVPRSGLLDADSMTVLQHFDGKKGVHLEVGVDIGLPPASTDGSGVGGVLSCEVDLPSSSGGGNTRAVVASASMNVTALLQPETTLTLTGLTVPSKDVELWMPAGYGKQPLYRVTVRWVPAVDNSTPRSQPQIVERRVGLRTVELVEAAAPVNKFNKTGTTFLFRVNGVEIFAKGANMIPADVLSTRATKEVWEWTLRSAAEANMNMVRVWGGGLYQIDGLYDLADELGLMIWQEFMFACALYPRDQSFLSLVRREVTYQVKRLQSHPSIIIWGGNNENEGALQWYPESTAHRDRYLVDYVTLYVDTVRDALRAIEPMGPGGGTPPRPFVDSSPSNGVLSREPYIKRYGDVSTWEFGDVHYYNYNADCEDLTTYPEARFVSEHGVQSFPSLASYAPLTAPEDRVMSSELMAYRQRHENGNPQVLAQMSRHLPVPAANGSEAGFGAYLWMSQLQQGRCYETAIGQWRRLKAVPSVKTYGILYWQLNDIWPGPSWSTLEHSGTWKQSHYFVKRSYAPIVVTAIHPTPSHNDTIEVHVSSDAMAGLHADVTVELWAWAGTSPLWTRSLSGHVDALSSSLVGSLDTATVLDKRAGTTVFLRIGLTTTTTTTSANQSATHPGGDVLSSSFRDTDCPPSPAPDAFFFFGHLKDADLPSSADGITVTAIKIVGRRRAAITLHSVGVAPYLSIEWPGQTGFFDDNAFIMLPGVRTVFFTSRADLPQSPSSPQASFCGEIIVRTLSNPEGRASAAGGPGCGSA